MLRSIFYLFILSLAARAQMPVSHVVVVSHRGEHLHHPENTIPAFQTAIDVGADFVEADVRTTADGKLILSHDATVDRRTNGHGEVAKMTFDELRMLDAGVKTGPEFAGTKMPSFDELLDLAKGKINIYVDVKQVSAKDLLSHLESHGMSDQVAIHAGTELSKEIETLNPKLKVSPMSVTVAQVNETVGQLHPKMMAFSFRYLTPEIITAAKQDNLQIYVDCMGSPDNPQGWQTAINGGAEWIQTDRPGELVKYLREKGLHQ
jgi:glycerophosphoryl diester phosphodiesterase